MKRRDFLRTIAALPVIPFVALAGPTPAGAQDIRTKHFLFRASIDMSMRERMSLRRYVSRWEDEGRKCSLILPDTVEMFRLEE